MSPVLFIMGVAGSGKTTVGKLLAERIKIPFFDADDFHAAGNKAKMKDGNPLTDEDREGWLKSLNQLAVAQQNKSGAIIACSALKQIYRDKLGQNLYLSKWFFLSGSPQLIYQRLQERKNHFMPAGLLQSQFDILEPPASATVISIENDPVSIVAIIMENLKL